MAFRSALSSLQRLRSSFEKMALLKLQVLHARIAKVRTAQKELQISIRNLRESNAVAVRQGTLSSELKMNSVPSVRAEGERLARMLAYLERELHMTEAEFLERRRERELVENVIASQRAAYEIESNRREQARVDGEVLQHQTRQKIDQAAEPADTRHKDDLL